MPKSVASDERRFVVEAGAGGQPSALTRRTGEGRTQRGWLHRLAGRLGEAALLLAVIWSLPLVILVVGAPIMLVVWIVSEIAARW